jgi:hypothetical protein
VCKLGSNQNIMFCERLGVKPHETRCAHVLEQGQLVVIKHIFLIGIMLAVLAEEMGEVALSLMATEIQIDAGSIFERALIGQGF